MEALTLSSPMIIEVVGLPGAGKSFFAIQFANTFGAALVSRDKIRWTLFAHHTYSENEEAMVDQVSNLMITELLRTKKTFVLDGGYNLASNRHALANLARKNGYCVLTIVVQTDQPTSKKRATKRSNKKPGDRFKQSLTDVQFDKSVKEYEEPSTTSADVVVISGKHTYGSQAKIVLRKMIETSGKSAILADRPQEPAIPRATITVKPRGPFVG